MRILAPEFAVTRPALGPKPEGDIVMLALRCNNQVVFQSTGDHNWGIAIATSAFKSTNLVFVVVEYMHLDVVPRFALGFGRLAQVPLRQMQAACARCVRRLSFCVRFIVAQPELAGGLILVVGRVGDDPAVGGSLIVDVLEYDAVTALTGVAALPCFATRDDWELLKAGFHVPIISFLSAARKVEVAPFHVPLCRGVLVRI